MSTLPLAIGYFSPRQSRGLSLMAKAKAVPTGIAFFFHMDHPRAGQTKNTQNLDRHELITKNNYMR